MKTFIEKLRDSKITNQIIFWCAVSLFALVVMSFFLNPKYEKGVALGMFAFSNAFSGVLAFKFGITTPGMPADHPQGNSTVKCPKCGQSFDLRDVS